MIPPALLIHTCTITHRAPNSTVDDYGVPGVTTTTTTGINAGSSLRKATSRC